MRVSRQVVRRTPPAGTVPRKPSDDLKRERDAPRASQGPCRCHPDSSVHRARRCAQAPPCRVQRGLHPSRAGHALWMGLARRHVLRRDRRRALPGERCRALHGGRRRAGQRAPRRSRPAGRGHGCRALRQLRRDHRLHAPAPPEQVAAFQPAPPRQVGHRPARHARGRLAGSPREALRDAPSHARAQVALRVPRRPRLRSRARPGRGGRGGRRRRGAMSADIAAGNTPAPARTVWREDMIAALTGFLLILGLFLDGWNHLNLQSGKAGDFLTPWHAVLYAGFNACAVWAITRNARLRAMMFPSRAKTGARAGAAAPAVDAGKVALLGIVLAGVGLVGDNLTRAAGSTAPIAPPFDFLVFTGAGIVFLVAMRAAVARFDIDRRVALPAMLAVGAAALAFFALGGSKTPAVQTAHKAGVAETPGVAQVSSAPAVIPARTLAPARVNRASAPARHARKAAIGSVPAVPVAPPGPPGGGAPPAPA